MDEELSSATCKADSNTLPTKLNCGLDCNEDGAVADIDEIEEFKDKQEDIDLDRLCARSDGSL